MKEITAFRASDGTLFESSSAARTHEKTLAPTLIVGLTAQQVEDALDRKNVELADAIETLASIITAKRMEQGDLRRRRRVINENGRGEPSGDGVATEGKEVEGAVAAPPPSASAADAGDPPDFLRRASS